MGYIEVNAIQCRNCGDLIFSRTRHDFRTCSCWDESHAETGVAIDGGREYRKISGEWDGKGHRIRINATQDDLIKDWRSGGEEFGRISEKRAKVLLDAADKEKRKVERHI